MWTRNPGAERMFTLEHYVEDPEVRRAAWQNRRDHPAWTAVPNDGHRALVALERTAGCGAVVTQNIDELHQRAGQSPDRVIEIHGTVFSAECLGCGRRIPMREALDRVDAGEPDPPCAVCGGILKSATISFGQSLRPEVLAAALDGGAPMQSAARDRLLAAGPAGRRALRGRGAVRRSAGDHQRPADAVRRPRRRRAPRADQRGAAAARDRAPRVVTAIQRGIPVVLTATLQLHEAVTRRLPGRP